MAIHLDDPDLDKAIDELVDNIKYVSRAHVVRVAVGRLIMQEQKEAEADDGKYN